MHAHRRPSPAMELDLGWKGPQEWPQLCKTAAGDDLLEPRLRDILQSVEGSRVRLPRASALRHSRKCGGFAGISRRRAAVLRTSWRLLAEGSAMIPSVGTSINWSIDQLAFESISIRRLASMPRQLAKSSSSHSMATTPPPCSTLRGWRVCWARDEHVRTRISYAR